MILRIWEGGGRGGKILSLILILDFSFFCMFITQKKDHFSQKKKKKTSTLRNHHHRTRGVNNHPLRTLCKKERKKERRCLTSTTINISHSITTRLMPNNQGSFFLDIRTIFVCTRKNASLFP